MQKAELEQIHANIAKLISEAGKLQAEQAKLNAERAKIGRETVWYPIAVAAGLLTAGAGAATVLARLLG